MAPAAHFNGNMEQDQLEPLAVIGFSLKFPEDAISPDSFWKMLMEKRCASKEIPKDRMNIDALYHPDIERHDTVYKLIRCFILARTYLSVELILILIHSDTSAERAFSQRGSRRFRCPILFHHGHGSCRVRPTATNSPGNGLQLDCLWRKLSVLRRQSIRGALRTTIKASFTKTLKLLQNMQLPGQPLRCLQIASVGSLTLPVQASTSTPHALVV